MEEKSEDNVVSGAEETLGFTVLGRGVRVGKAV